MNHQWRPVREVKRRQRRKPLSEEIHSMYRLLTVTIIILGVTCTGAYLYTNSDNSAQGYTLKQLQIENETLQSEHRKLEHRVIEAQSFIQLEGEETIEDMTETENADFTYLDEDGGLAKHE
ncbi:hypothetical protein HOD30_02985 [Candidatus Peregrinibacteria bacterium]|jgi:hypothetical protein|nr:hypothetical protein [Candidatus Peregrinibacteria bacterium]MBT4632059.1 hypothetical protein [Candidatus Peregrinibacteria bacterium]MBT5516292.1 hypothetical protein [Candidatus Peregrinibacteria bacterium]MBT5823713.1 hypothetical protein [Candidatus Peregrinibacteria bacterium]